MTDIQLLIMIALSAVGIALTRFLPFLVFSSDKPTPKYLVYLGKVLPPAVFGMLVVYCLKDLSFALRRRQMQCSCSRQDRSRHQMRISSHQARRCPFGTRLVFGGIPPSG